MQPDSIQSWGYYEPDVSFNDQGLLFTELLVCHVNLIPLGVVWFHYNTLVFIFRGKRDNIHCNLKYKQRFTDDVTDV